MFRLVCLGIGYVIGCISTAFIVGKLTKTDLRKKGSGNLGTTNALRVLGFRAGAATFVGDILKAVLAFCLCRVLFRENGLLAGQFACAGAILGHDFPFYLKGKGGKGIAATIGMVLCLGFAFSPSLAIVSLAVGILGVVLTNYISAGSIAFVIAIPLMALVTRYPLEGILVLTALTLLALWQHRENFKRLREGTERKFTLRKNVE